MTRLFISFICAIFMASTAISAEIGDDGLHKETWIEDTFKDLQEDLAEATAQDKRLMVMVEQRGCIYCAKMHEEIFSKPKIRDYIEKHYYVIQLNMFGDVDVTDFDGTTLSEKNMVKKWGVLFTPTILFFPENVANDTTAIKAAVAVMPGAFGPGTTFNMLNWVVAEGYKGDEPFQKYHARKLADTNKE